MTAETQRAETAKKLNHRAGYAWATLVVLGAVGCSGGATQSSISEQASGAEESGAEAPVAPGSDANPDAEETTDPRLAESEGSAVDSSGPSQPEPAPTEATTPREEEPAPTELQQPAPPTETQEPELPESEPPPTPDFEAPCALTDDRGSQTPFDVLSLGSWRLDIPFDEDMQDGPTRESDIISRPQLENFRLEGFFEANACNNGVVFTAHTGGATTDGSGYPRTELREMTEDGEDTASWSSTSGRHTLRIVQRVNQLPATKSHVVIGQIHNRDDDVAVFRLEGERLWATDGDSKVEPPIYSFYQLGQTFEAKFVVENGNVDYYYNGNLVRRLEREFSGAYFKAGSYVQSSCGGEKEVPGEACDEIGQVEIFELEVTHE